VELLLRQLQKLSKATQQFSRLRLVLDLSLIRDIGDVWKLPSNFQDLLAAIQAELIQPLWIRWEPVSSSISFARSRPASSYALIDESQKQVVHLQIGRNLLEKTSPEQQPDRLFAIVDHSTGDCLLYFNQNERNARLNLMAGQQSQQRLMKQLFSSRQGLNSSIQRVGKVSMTSPYRCTQKQQEQVSSRLLQWWKNL